jgi:predicted nucleotidyltransferase
MIGYTVLEELFGSKVRARVIAALLVAPGRRLHVRALVRSAGGSVASVQREIERLGDMGLVTSAVDENGRRQVSLVEGHPLMPGLAGLLAADPRAQYGARVAAVPNMDPRVAEVLGGAVDAIVTGFDPIRIVLFGSRSNGTADEDSDIDLLVVLSEVRDDHATSVRIRDVIGAIGYGVDVIPTDQRRMEQARTRHVSVVRTALEEGTTLYERGA